MKERKIMPSLMRRINVISRCATLYRTERLKDTELNGNHHSYILLICREPGITQEQISRRLYINKSNVTRQLNYLETHGFVERKQSDKDKRMTLVYPTQKATDILPTVRGVMRDWNDYLCDGLSEDEIEQLSIIIGKMADKAKEYGNLHGDDDI